MKLIAGSLVLLQAECFDMSCFASAFRLSQSAYLGKWGGRARKRDGRTTRQLRTNRETFEPRASLTSVLGRLIAEQEEAVSPTTLPLQSLPSTSRRGNGQLVTHPLLRTCSLHLEVGNFVARVRYDTGRDDMIVSQSLSTVSERSVQM